MFKPDENDRYRLACDELGCSAVAETGEGRRVAAVAIAYAKGWTVRRSAFDKRRTLASCPLHNRKG